MRISQSIYESLVGVFLALFPLMFVCVWPIMKDDWRVMAPLAFFYGMFISVVTSKLAKEEK